MDVEMALMEYSTSEEPVTVAELNELYDQLEAVDEEFMLGRWSGGCFNTGHPGEALLNTFNWCGKEFLARDNVEPMLCRNDDGDVVASDVLGKAQLRRVEYRGVVTATMVYDQHPIFDHFKKVNRCLVLGVMDRKGDAEPLFFFLNRAS